MKVHTNAPHPVIVSAIRQLVDYVAPTYGAAGRGILVDKGYEQQVLDDGYAVIEEFELANELENAVIAYVKDASKKANKRAGDGTTTAILIMAAIVQLVLDESEHSLTTKNYPAIAKELRAGLVKAVEQIKKAAKPIKTLKELKSIALNSYNNPEMADVIAEMVSKVGIDGTLAIEQADTLETTTEIVTGLRFERGFVSPYLINNDSGTISLKNPHVIITDETFSKMEVLLPVLQPMLAAGKKDYLIIADDITGEALQALIVNKMRGNINIAAVKAPGYGDRRKELLEDIATVTGATVLSSKVGRGLATITPGDLGSAKSVVVSKDDTLIVDGAGKKGDIQKRADLIRPATETGSEFDRDFAKERLAALMGGVGVIRVGALTEVELKAKKSKIEDAINSTRLAAKDGVILGGGVMLGQIKSGSALLDAALKEPRRILEVNGIDAITPDVHDAAGVLIASIESGVSVAAELITSGGIIATKREKKDEKDA